MITIDSLAKIIEQGLNVSANAYKFKFKIFVDAGKFKRAKKTRTQKELYINSLLRVGESNIIPTQNIEIATQTAVLEICVPIFTENQIDEVTNLFRNMLDGYFARYKVQTIDGYSVSSIYSLASTGTLEARGNIGPSLTFYVNMSFAYIQNGLNSYNCVFKLDGNIIPYSTAKMTKTATSESDTYSNSNGVGKNINTVILHGFDFEIPALSNGIGADIISELLGDDLKTKHTLEVDLNGVTKTYSVIYGQSNISLEGVTNGGHVISFIEAV